MASANAHTIISPFGAALHFSACRTGRASTGSCPGPGRDCFMDPSIGRNFKFKLKCVAAGAMIRSRISARQPGPVTGSPGPVLVPAAAAGPPGPAPVASLGIAGLLRIGFNRLMYLWTV
jgi:hypothetical protein